MRHTSYLLVLDGSAESRAAAHLTWNLAEKTGARVLAQHVINVPAIWRLLSFRPPGFIGSGPYIEANERIKESLRSIADTLMLSYTTQAEGRNIDFETYIDEGDPVTEISKRAYEHDMLIIGHDRITADPRQTSTYSLCEELAETCPCSMLIVNATCDSLRKMQIRAATASIETDTNTSDSFSEFARTVGLPTNLKSLLAARSADELRSYIRSFEQPALLLWHQPGPTQMLAS